MAKKYIPSGYIIVDLGELDLSSPVTITDEEVIKSLIENARKEHSKPILLTFTDTDAEVRYSGFLVEFADIGMSTERTYHLNDAVASIEVYIYFETPSVTITRME